MTLDYSWSFYQPCSKPSGLVFCWITWTENDFLQPERFSDGADEMKPRIVFILIKEHWFLCYAVLVQRLRYRYTKWPLFHLYFWCCPIEPLAPNSSQPMEILRNYGKYIWFSTMNYPSRQLSLDVPNTLPIP